MNMGYVVIVLGWTALIGLICYTLGKYEGTWGARSEVLTTLTDLMKLSNERTGRCGTPSARYYRMMTVKRLIDLLEERWNYRG